MEKQQFVENQNKQVNMFISMYRNLKNNII